MDVSRMAVMLCWIGLFFFPLWQLLSPFLIFTLTFIPFIPFVSYISDLRLSMVDYCRWWGLCYHWSE